MSIDTAYGAVSQVSRLTMFSNYQHGQSLDPNQPGHNHWHQLENGSWVNMQFSYNPDNPADTPYDLDFQFSVPSVLYGHNLGGGNHWHDISRALLKACCELGVILTCDDKARIKQGDYLLKRVDVCIFIELPTGFTHTELFKSLNLIAADQRKSHRLVVNATNREKITLYIGSGKYYSETKLYAKYLHLFSTQQMADAFVQNHPLAERVMEFLKNKVRVEYTWANKALKQHKLTDPREWTPKKTRARAEKAIRKHLKLLTPFNKPKAGPLPVELSDRETALLDTYYRQDSTPVNRHLYAEATFEKYRANIARLAGVDVLQYGEKAKPITTDLLARTWFVWPKGWRELFDGEAWRSWYSTSQGVGKANVMGKQHQQANYEAEDEAETLENLIGQ